jgi:diguanylate cyclase (GGDEF)-like protein
MRLSIKTKLFLSHFLTIVLVSGSVGTFFYRTAVDSLFESLRARLRNSAALLSRVLDARTLEDIRLPADIAKPAYQDALRVLRDYQATNKDIAFVYVMRREGNRIVFVLDSDPTEEQALPGQIYESPVPRLWEGFRSYSADDEIEQDRWGYFLSGYAPLKNGADRYLVGLDMRADEVQRKFHTIRIAGLVSLGISILLAWMFSWWLARRITRPVHRLVTRTGEIAEGRLAGTVEERSGDEIGDLAKAFNRMSGRLAASRQETETAMEKLREAHDTLEHRVQERTAELAAVNEDLRLEIVERKRMEQELAKAATTDFLTGLLNRLAMLHLIEQEVGRIRRTTPPFSLILADLDDFKAINDAFGHEAGDEVLLRVARILRDNVRAQDDVARWGGDELLLFLPETPATGAMEVARKIMESMAGCSIEAAGQRHAVRLSMGVSTIGPGMSVNECLRRADEALYRAKTAGRNQVVAAGEDGPV